MDTKNFIKNIDRAQKRNAILLSLKEAFSKGSKSIRDIIGNAKRRENQQKPLVDRFDEQLKSSDDIVSDRFYSLLSQAVEETIEKLNLQGTIAISIAGSNAHGGTAIREIMQNVHADIFDGWDFDYVILSSEKISPQDRNTIEEGIRSEFVHLQKKLPELPNNFSLHQLKKNQFFPLLYNTDEALNQLKADPDNSHVYFQPTIPPEVGIRQKELLLLALRKLFSEDQSFWRQVTKTIKMEIRDNKKLKLKHFGMQFAMYSRRNQILSERILRDSHNFLPNSLIQQIESTGRP